VYAPLFFSRNRSLNSFGAVIGSNILFRPRVSIRKRRDLAARAFITPDTSVIYNPCESSLSNSMKKRILLIVSLLLGGIPPLFAGDDTSKDTTVVPGQVPAFRYGAQEVELQSGALFSVGNNSPTQPPIGYAIQIIRYGWMFNDVYGSSFWRGNDELMLEGFGGEVFTGPGHGLGGGTLILRHNFVQEGWPLVPYLQIGGGGLYNDIYQNQVQQRVGEGFEFMAHADLGVRWIINKNWAISSECEFRHISDGDLAARNGGLDSLGVTLGVNFLF
jgi:hypothetical protein